MSEVDSESIEKFIPLFPDINDKNFIFDITRKQENYELKSRINRLEFYNNI